MNAKSYLFILPFLVGYVAYSAAQCATCSKPKSSETQQQSPSEATDDNVREKRQAWGYGSSSGYSNYYYPQQYSYNYGASQQRASCLMQSILNHKIFCARKKRDIEPQKVDKNEQKKAVETALKKAHESVSIDLATAAKAELRQLELFESHPQLFSEDAIANAIRRYETCWLPMKPDLNMTAPLDVMLVWHAHMLRPSAYQEDSLRIAGDVVDHSYSGHGSGLNETVRRWNSVCPGEPFEWVQAGPIQDYKPLSTYDIAAAVKRQQGSAKKIVELNLTNAEIDYAVDQYRKFLAIAAAYPHLAIGPTLEMDLVWHAHQVHPLAYARDTEEITGEIIDHIDDLPDDEEAQLPDELFSEHFGGN